MFRNMLTSYANSVSRHTGVHYVPSFNDLNSQCQDDLEEVDALSAASRQTLSSSSASERGRGGGGGTGGDDLSSYRYKGPVGQPPAPEPSMVERNRMEGRMSNKENDAVPGFDPNPDIYKISVPRPEHRADWVYDRPRGNKTSIWQYIAKGQEDPMGKTSSPDSIYTHTSA